MRLLFLMRYKFILRFSEDDQLRENPSFVPPTLFCVPQVTFSFTIKTQETNLDHPVSGLKLPASSGFRWSELGESQIKESWFLFVMSMAMSIKSEILWFGA